MEEILTVDTNVIVRLLVEDDPTLRLRAQPAHADL